VEEDLHRVDVSKRRLSIRQLHGGDTQGPDVRLEAVPILLDDFGGHPEWRTNECVALRLDVGQLGRNAKVGQLDFASLRKQDIGGLDISMDLALLVQVLDAQQQFAADDGNVRLAKVGRFQLW
jgi:hypothetical protein